MRNWRTLRQVKAQYCKTEQLRGVGDLEKSFKMAVMFHVLP